MTLAWAYLLAGTIGEVIWVLTLKSTQGFTKLGPTALNLVIAIFNIWVLSRAFQLLPTAMAYSIWIGASMVLVAACAWFFQGEQITIQKGIFIAIIIVGVIGLKFSSAS